jgi:hypothetical protein
MVPVAPFAQKKSGDTITRQPAKNIVLTRPSFYLSSLLSEHGITYTLEGNLQSSFAKRLAAGAGNRGSENFELC